MVTIPEITSFNGAMGHPCHGGLSPEGNFHNHHAFSPLRIRTTPLVRIIAPPNRNRTDAGSDERDGSDAVTDTSRGIGASRRLLKSRLLGDVEVGVSW
jgi:hypothetical protein